MLDYLYENYFSLYMLILPLILKGLYKKNKKKQDDFIRMKSGLFP